MDYYIVCDKDSLHFLTFDILDFYANISGPLLLESVELVQTLTHVTPDDLEIIQHASKSLLGTSGDVLVKKPGP